jgi:Zinc-finger associated domain (zf-AD)
MAGYRCVNFSDLCRLCSNAASDNIQIYAEEDLQKKIVECLSINIQKLDKLPKIICSSCHEYVEIFYEFRKSCTNAQKMLESCINTTKLRSGGQVYIKDEVAAKKNLKSLQNQSPPKLIPNLNLCNIIATSPVKHAKNPNVSTPSQHDLISSIMQAVGIPVCIEKNIFHLI